MNEYQIGLWQAAVDEWLTRLHKWAKEVEQSEDLLILAELPSPPLSRDFLNAAEPTARVLVEGCEGLRYCDGDTHDGACTLWDFDQ